MIPIYKLKFFFVSLLILFGFGILFAQDFPGRGSYLNNAESFLNTPTYDGSGEVVHPSIVYFPDSWNNYKYWMAMTPYPDGNNKYENPSILVSDDGIKWIVPNGLANPVVERLKYGYNADPDILYNPDTDELWIYYIESITRRKYQRYSLKYLKSSDGINWSSPGIIFEYEPVQMVSPSIIYKDSKYVMWSVNSGEEGWQSNRNFVEMRCSTDGINWTPPGKVFLFQKGYIVWHIDVLYNPAFNEYWMLVAAYPVGMNALYTRLFFVKSKDGIFWDALDKPIIDCIYKDKWDSQCIYRSTFIYDELTDNVKIWYSAYDNFDWHIGYIKFEYMLFYQKISDLLSKDFKDKNFIGLQNIPNPLVNETTIVFELKESSNVRIDIYSITGKKVKSLVNFYYSPGIHTASWDGKNEQGLNVANGMYLYNFRTEKIKKSRTFIVLR